MLKQWIGHAFLRAAGWQMQGERPALDQYVIIAAPHTSNWDMPFMLAMAFVYDVPLGWMGKHTLFRPGFKPLLEALGGIPIERHRAGNVVEQMVARFRAGQPLALLVPTEGTRSRVEYWKSGFYRIAREANVPIVMSYLDFGNKVGGMGPVLEPTGNMRADMDKVREFYADKKGLYPERFGPIRLREEESSTAAREEPAGE